MRQVPCEAPAPAECQEEGQDGGTPCSCSQCRTRLHCSTHARCRIPRDGPAGPSGGALPSSFSNHRDGHSLLTPAPAPAPAAGGLWRGRVGAPGSALQAAAGTATCAVTAAPSTTPAPAAASILAQGQLRRRVLPCSCQGRPFSGGYLPLLLRSLLATTPTNNWSSARGLARTMKRRHPHTLTHTFITSCPPP